MKIYEEKSLADFEFWSGAKDNAAMLTIEELEQLGGLLEESVRLASEIYEEITSYFEDILSY